MYYAVYGDGFSFAELKEHAKLLRRELLLCDDVAKIDLIGDQREVVYFEISRARLASMGITIPQIQALIAGQNLAADSGHLTVGDRYIRIDPTGKNIFVSNAIRVLNVHRIILILGLALILRGRGAAAALAGVSLLFHSFPEGEGLVKNGKVR